jgi:hypothetical protein
LDVHAVCNEIDIPWADEKIQQEWARHFPQGWDKWLAEAKRPGF